MVTTVVIYPPAKPFLPLLEDIATTHPIDPELYDTIDLPYLRQPPARKRLAALWSQFDIHEGRSVGVLVLYCGHSEATLPI